METMVHAAPCSHIKGACLFRVRGRLGSRGPSDRRGLCVECDWLSRNKEWTAGGGVYEVLFVGWGLLLEVGGIGIDWRVADRGKNGLDWCMDG